MNTNVKGAAQKSHKICFDAKKVGKDLDNVIGDVDLSGYGSVPTLKERTKRLSQEKEITEEGICLIESWEAKDHELSGGADSVIDEDKLKLQDLCKNIIHILSIRIQEQRTPCRPVRQHYAKDESKILPHSRHELDINSI